MLEVAYRLVRIGKHTDYVFCITNHINTLLILDDLGVEIDNKFYKSCLYEIIEKRINSGLPMIINSNLNIQGLSAKYDERIASRLSAFIPLEFQGHDIRQIKRATD